MSNVKFFDFQHVPIYGETSKRHGLIVLDDVKEIICYDIILKMKQPTENQNEKRNKKNSKNKFQCAQNDVILGF